MFDHILVPTDGSDRAATAIEVGRRIAEREGAQLTLLRVESERAALDDILADTASMERQAAEMRSSGTATDYRLEYGRPENGIAIVAAEEGCKLIVMSHQHRGLLATFRRPSVTARTITRAPAPILIWPEATPPEALDDLLTQPGATVIVPLDGSEEAERALPLATAFARKYGKTLTLVRAIVPVPYAGTGNPYYLEVEAQVDQEQEARDYLAQIRQRLAAETGLTVQSMLLVGDAAEQIMDTATTHEGSLIVMSTHGRTGLGKLFFGSVTARVINHATVPVLVVPPPCNAKADEKQEAKQNVDEQRLEPAPAGQWAPMF